MGDSRPLSPAALRQRELAQYVYELGIEAFESTYRGQIAKVELIGPEYLPPSGDRSYDVPGLYTAYQKLRDAGLEADFEPIKEPAGLLRKRLVGFTLEIWRPNR